MDLPKQILSKRLPPISRDGSRDNSVHKRTLRASPDEEISGGKNMTEAGNPLRSRLLNHGSVGTNVSYEAGRNVSPKNVSLRDKEKMKLESILRDL